MKITLYISAFLISISFNLTGQDIHWSQYDHNPVFQNPASVGQFNGDYRFHGNFRDQWRSVTVPFQTFQASAEAKGVLLDNLNFGLYIFNDAAGDGTFRTIEIQPSVSYVHKLTNDSTHLLRGGVQMGLNLRSFNAGAFNFDNQWNGAFFDNALPTNEDFANQGRTNFTWGTGVSYEYQQSKRKRITAGLGLFNINRPNQGFFGEKIKRDIRFNLFARAEYEIGFDWDILPSIQLNLQGKYREFIMGSQVRYVLKDRLGIYQSLMAGAFLRSSDAGYIVVGGEYQNWWAGVSYDINFSSLYVASKARGGIELSIRYILQTFNPRQIKHRVCPDYI
jgi:type IX secretion system PorP/SprF family membrane protein